jgi:hypothetical protein
MKAEAETNTRTFEPIPIYHEGVFDRKYWYTLQTKRYLLAKGKELAHQIDSIFVEHTLAR